MDKAKLIKWKTNPVQIGKTEIEELEKLSLEFPYFSLVHILLARGYKNLNHFRFNAQLKKAALYCEDRTWLYDFLNSEEVVKVEETIEVKEKPIPVTKKEKVVLVKEKPTEVIADKEAVAQEKIRVSEKPFALNIEKSWKIKEKKKESGIVPKVEEKKEPVKEIKVKAPQVKKEIVKPVEKKVPPVLEKVEAEKKEEKNEVVAKEAKIEKKVEKKKTEKKKGKKKPKKAKKRKKEVLDEQSLLDELINENIQYNLEDYYTAEDVLEPLDEQTPVEEKKEEVQVEGEHDFFAWLKQTEEVAEEPKPEKVETKKRTPKKKPQKTDAHKSISIIDDFLSANTTNTRKKAEFFSPVEMAKRSDQLESEIVSETLAGVYEEQERYEEAIMTYEKLILLFPQKEAYFAGRIKDLRELNNKK